MTEGERPVSSMSLDVGAVQSRLRRFAAERDWEQFHNPKNLAMAMVVEAAEVAEHFQWLTPAEAVGVTEDSERRGEVAGELADVTIYLLRLADTLDIDLAPAIWMKIDRNEGRFPPTGHAADARPTRVPRIEPNERA